MCVRQKVVGVSCVTDNCHHCRMQVLAMFHDHLDQLKFQFHLYAQFSPAEEEHAHTMEFDALTINTFGAYIAIA